MNRSIFALSRVLLTLVVLGSTTTAQTQALPGAPRGAETPSARLGIMNRAVARYTVRSADPDRVAFPLHAEPVLRFTNTVGQTFDGAVFVWTGGGGRTEAAVQVFQRRDGIWIQELISLSTRPLVAANLVEPAWMPTVAGVAFADIPGAPTPAATPEQRLAQIRALARRFTIDDNFQRKSWQRLRMLARPLLRYGDPEGEPIDGALLGYVLTTDPEAFLMLEARADGGMTRWRYALARMTTYPLRARLDAQAVWSVDYLSSNDARSALDPFHVRRFNPED